MLLYSILLCVERCGLIALWAKLVFLHLGERSEVGANVAPCGFLDGITIADRFRLRDFNRIIQGDSQQTFNTATWEIYSMFVHRYENNPTITTVLDLQQLCCFPSESCVFLVTNIFIIVKCADYFFNLSINAFLKKNKMSKNCFQVS